MSDTDVEEQIYDPNTFTQLKDMATDEFQTEDIYIKTEPTDDIDTHKEEANLQGNLCLDLN